MTEQIEPEPREPAPPEPAKAVVHRSRFRGRVSAVWLFPLVAIVIGVGLLVRTFERLGPEVLVTVDSASGLSVDKTTVRYRDMEMGVVEAIELTDDLSQVTLRARLHPVVEPFLTEDARFWVAKPRVSLSGVSGLETLVSGSYVAFSPGTEGGASQRAFEALAVPPISVGPGTRYVVEADTLGYLETGDPIYYRGERVGTVLLHSLHADARSVGIAVHVDHPYDALVRTDTVFWNTSGVRAHLGWKGFELETPTLESALEGAISFATPDHPGPPAKAGSVFALRDVVDDKWMKWSPKIWIGHGTETAGREGSAEIIERQAAKLFHHRGAAAGDPSTDEGGASWFRGLYHEVTSRIE